MQLVLNNPTELDTLAQQIKCWGRELGFQQIGITAGVTQQDQEHLFNWLAAGYHGDMNYMAQHQAVRCDPAQLLPGTIRIITARMNYLPAAGPFSTQSTHAIIARYALGRDYHRVMRKRLKQLAQRIEQQIGSFHYRPLVDSAPVLEKPLAQQAGLGWIGKHTNLINQHAGSWFFLGELYVDLPLPIDSPAANHCGRCHACLMHCPTAAIIAPYQLDARRCVAYLTIEHHGAIPESLRSLIGQHIFGCDICQQVCPWNRFAQSTQERDFHPRPHWINADLVTLFNWNEPQFLQYTEGTPIRRIGYQRWLRNLAVALGNAPPSLRIRQALIDRLAYHDELVREHVQWALIRQDQSLTTS